MYLNFLGGYEAQEVVDAFNHYVKHKSEFPTPSDIIGIIEGRIKRDSAYYRKLLTKQKHSIMLASEAIYIKKYENQLHEEW
jgi:hypothetical protein